MKRFVYCTELSLNIDHSLHIRNLIFWQIHEFLQQLSLFSGFYHILTITFKKKSNLASA